MSRSGNTNSWQNVQAAENRADAQTGVLALAIGFGIQACTTIYSIGHAAPAFSGGWTYFVTTCWVVIPAFLVWYADRKVKWFWVRRYLIELSHYNRGGERVRLPDVRELERYGSVMEENRQKRLGESDAEYLRRVWRVKHKHAQATD
jgi:hypothetical protein